MPLLALPPENLLMIFDEVGPSFFHRDIDRLTICKKWYELALPTALRLVKLNQASLSTLMYSLESEPEKLKAIANCVQSLELQLIGFYGGGQGRSASNAQRLSERLNQGLARIAADVIQKAQKLHTLHMRTIYTPYPDPRGNVRQPFPIRLMKSLLSSENLTVLVLDLSVSVESTTPEGGPDHICLTIAGLLKNLKTFHVRMANICPCVLQPPADSAEMLPLSEVVVNLSLIEEFQGTTIAAHSKRCGAGYEDFKKLKSDLIEEAEVLATRMTSPKMLRILTLSIPQFKMQSFDVVTRQTSILDKRMAWNADGWALDEEEAQESNFSGADFLARLYEDRLAGRA